ncbi:hypothetical protein ACFOOK_20435 [Micromonospora krabiensis]|uniref:Uncharacterized protein n=1 Tax=Micromonospora krabiensis TaxID=307121 RepID=A0A1C3N941_9ACTN|nr:hypothetical protein [Micromonospora krabiensis]SBV29063.1 hypothetical protein GA0070620_4625 [Micromonospora krabiensis]
MPPIRIRPRRQPFETAILVAAAVCGLLLILLDVGPPSVELAMPPPVQTGWRIGLVAVGLVGLLGILWPGRVSTGLGIELAALLMLGTSAGMYALTLTVVSGRHSIAATSFVAAVATGSFWRSAQILLDLRRLARACSLESSQPIGDVR